MKRISALLGVVFLLLSFAGCAKEEPSSTPTVEAAPVTTPSAMPSQTPDVFLRGSWVNISDGEITDLEFTDVSAIITDDTEQRSAEYFYAGGMVTLSDAMEITLRVVEEDGVLHLKRDALEIDLVQQENAWMYANRKIELSMDNWQDYFELRKITHVNEEPNTGIQYRSFGAGFFLKEEFLDALLPGGENLNISVTIEYDSRCHIVYEPFSEEYVITDEINIWQPAPVGARDIASVVDRRSPDRGVSHLSDLYGQVAAYLAVDGGYEEFPVTFNYQIIERMEVVNVEGFMIFGPEY